MSEAMIPANTEVTCPACETDFEILFILHEGQRIVCRNCNTVLILIDGDLEEEDIAEDITAPDDEELGDEDEEEEEDDTRVPIAHVRPTEPDDEGRK